jgi:PAS domain S-box-containing protein
MKDSMSENNSYPDAKGIIFQNSEEPTETMQELDSVATAISDLQKTKEALRESEEKYRMLFSNVPLGILHFDSNGIITNCNENFVNIIDLQKESITGKYLSEVIDLHLVSAIENALSGTIGHYEGDFVSKTSGKITYVRVNFAPIILDNGLNNGGVGIFEDITERKQIEKIFFHDIMNTAGNLLNFTELLEEEDQNIEERKELIQVFGGLAKQIINEINTHRHLLTSGKNEIKLNIKKIHSTSFLEGMLDFFDHPDIFNSKKINISNDSEDIEFETDETILSRIIGNMIKNSIEASSPNEEITLKCSLKNEMIRFSVHNSVVMPDEIQQQLFTRSVSTKGAGRGLGIYSMKYLTETYLHGSVSFTSTKEKGTTFIVSYPLKYSSVEASI